MLRKNVIPKRSRAEKRRKLELEIVLSASQSSQVEEHEGHSAFRDSEQQWEGELGVSMPLFVNAESVHFDFGQNKKSPLSPVKQPKSCTHGAQQNAFVGAFLVEPDEVQTLDAPNDDPPVLLHFPSPPPRRNKALEAANITPVKFHISKRKLGEKAEGVNKAGCIIETASGTVYMFKPHLGKETWSFWEMVHEITAGNLFRLYMGKNRAPRIGVLSSQLQGEEQFGVSSEMFQFTQLSKYRWRDKKPKGFEKIIVTSAFLGDPDPHCKNVGYNADGELSKVDHGRAYLAEYLNGLDFLDFLTRMCEYNFYTYILSIAGIERQLNKIKSFGMDLPKAIISDAIACIEEHARDDLMPCKIKSFRKGRWVDRDALKTEFRCYRRGVICISNWGMYRKDIINVFNSNFSVIDDALGILANMKLQDYEGIMIASNSSTSMPVAPNPKVCSDFQSYLAAIQAERDKTSVPGKLNITSHLDFYRDAERKVGRGL